MFEDQRHFPADVENVQTANSCDIRLKFYSKINQLKTARVRQPICRDINQSKRKAKPSKQGQAKFKSRSPRKTTQKCMDRMDYSFCTERFIKKNCELSVNLVVLKANGNITKFSFSTSENVSASNSYKNPNKLMQCGDIETNPGPTENKLRSSAGRKKKRGFQNKSTAENVKDTNHNSGYESQFCTNELTLPSIIRDTPIGLRNGANCCFMNSALQVLYFMPTLREFLNNHIVSHPGNPTLTALKVVFDEMSMSSKHVTVANYFTQLKGNFNWKLGHQQDSNEFLIHILEQLYTKGPYKELVNDCPFKIITKSTRACTSTNCSHHSTKYDKNCTLPLSVSCGKPISIKKLVESHISMEELVSYNCEMDNCDGVYSNKIDEITNVSEYLIIQLNLFDFNHITNAPIKLKPHIEINEKLNILGNDMNLYAIVFHSGNSAKAGHYTSAVLVKNKWYMTNDVTIIDHKVINGNNEPWEPKSIYWTHDMDFPYIVIYKNSGNINSNLNELTSNTIPNSTLHTPC